MEIPENSVCIKYGRPIKFGTSYYLLLDRTWLKKNDIQEDTQINQYLRPGDPRIILVAEKENIKD